MHGQQNSALKTNTQIIAEKLSLACLKAEDGYECLDYFVEQGNMTGRPYSKPLGNGIFELRASTNKEEARFLYFFHPTKRKIAVIATAFKKKTRKTPSGEIEAAKKVKKLVTANTEIPNEIPVYN